MGFKRNALDMKHAHMTFESDFDLESRSLDVIIVINISAVILKPIWGFKGYTFCMYQAGTKYWHKNFKLE